MSDNNTITVTMEIPAPPEGWVYDGARAGKRGEKWWDGFEWVTVAAGVDGIVPVAIRKQQTAAENVAAMKPGTGFKYGDAVWFKARKTEDGYTAMNIQTGWVRADDFTGPASTIEVLWEPKEVQP